MLEVQNISEKAKDFEKIKRLYESAFPYKERLPILDLLENREETTFCAVYENELLCGLICLLSFRGITHIWQLWNPVEIKDMDRKSYKRFMR